VIQELERDFSATTQLLQLECPTVRMSPIEVRPTSSSNRLRFFLSNTRCGDCDRLTLVADNASAGPARVMDSFRIRTSFTLISRLSPTTILRAQDRLFKSSVLPRTIRRSTLRPSGPDSRHLKLQTSAPRLRRSTVTLPSCMSLLLSYRELLFESMDMLVGRLAMLGATANVAMRRQR